MTTIDTGIKYRLYFIPEIDLPKNLVLVTIGMAMLSIAKLGFPLYPITVRLVLLIFTDKMFVLNQYDNLIISVCMSLATSFNFGPVLYKVV